MHMYICAYTYIHTYTHTYIHTCIQTYIHIYIYIYIYIYTYIHIYIYTYIHIYIYIYTYIHIYLYTYIPIYLYTYIHIYIYTYTHIWSSKTLLLYTTSLLYTCMHLFNIHPCIHTYGHIHVHARDATQTIPPQTFQQAMRSTRGMRFLDLLEPGLSLARWWWKRNGLGFCLRLSGFRVFCKKNIRLRVFFPQLFPTAWVWKRVGL